MPSERGGGRRVQFARTLPQRVAGRFPQQLAYLTSTATYVLAGCSRRAGKTYANCTLLLQAALTHDGSTSVYTALTLDQADRSAFRATFLPMLARWRIPHTIAGMTVRFRNGSQVIFGSLDDPKHVSSWLGMSLQLAIMDEVQDSSRETLLAAEGAFEPAISTITDAHPEPGRLIWSGTWPELEAGRFVELWKDSRREASSYEFHSWSRMQNPMLRDQEAQLGRVLKRRNMTVDDPYIQRTWYGTPVWDASASAFGWRESAAYEPPAALLADLPIAPGRWAAPDPSATYAVGIDEAGLRDRYAIVLLAKVGDTVWQAGEWVTQPAANPLRTQITAVLVWIRRTYGDRIIAWRRDSGSASVHDDSLAIEHGIPIIEPADKREMRAQVEHVRDLLASGRLRVLRGSSLAEDFQRSRWDSDQADKGRWKWHSSHHPDAADACRYALPTLVPRVDAPGAAPPTTLPGQQAAAAAAALDGQGVTGYGSGWRRDEDAGRMRGGYGAGWASD